MRHLWFLRNRKGQGMVEYVLLVALVAACLVAILGLTRNAAHGAYARTSAKIGPVARASKFGGGSVRGSSGGSWLPPAQDQGSASEADSAGTSGPSDPGSPPVPTLPVGEH